MMHAMGGRRSGLLLHLASHQLGGLLLAGILLLVDGVIDGSFILSLGVCPIWLVIAFVRACSSRADNALRAARVLLPQLTLLLVLANYHLQVKVAMGNATRIIQACERYRGEHGSYPDRLTDLVPRFLSAVPRAKYCLADASFRYSGPPANTLAWQRVPPFGRMVYLFRDREWRYVD
jgi:hypothetical protein